MWNHKKCAETYKRKYANGEIVHWAKRKNPQEVKETYERIAVKANLKKIKNPDKACLNCGSKIIRNRNRNKFCSLECNYKYKKKHSPVRAAVRCMNCGGDIVGMPRQNRKFCTAGCSASYHQKKRKEILTQRYASNPKKCWVCGRGIPFERRKRKTCCRGCFVKSRTAEFRGQKFFDDIGKKVSRLFSRLPDDEKQRRLKIFKNAPEYQRGKIFSSEKKIIDLNIPCVRYVGDGSLWVTFKNGKHKNADFAVDPICATKKVIEIGDFERWHTEQERLDVINEYSKIGYECLYLRDDDENYKEKILEFVNEGN